MAYSTMFYFLDEVKESMEETTFAEAEKKILPQFKKVPMYFWVWAFFTLTSLMAVFFKEDERLTIAENNVILIQQELNAISQKQDESNVKIDSIYEMLARLGKNYSE